MNLAACIPLRKSVRSYTPEPMDDVTLEKIADFIAGAKPLFPEIPFAWRLLSREQVKCICPWTTPQCIAIFTREEPGALENVGFIFQQLDLYLCSLGLGACWLGMGKPVRGIPAEPGMKFVMMIAFGHPRGEAQRKSAAEFKRKSLAEISDTPDERLEGARLAPSSVNSQPWRFTHQDQTIHVHCVRQPLVKMLSDMNRIDVGIALAHVYLTHPDSFAFFRDEGASSPRGCGYIGSFTL